MAEVVNVVIADDEPLARARLRRLILADGRVQVAGEFCDSEGLLNAIDSGLRPLAAFLDIRMPGMDGLNLARWLPVNCALVFSTAFADHAVGAYRLDAVDYLLKPIELAQVRTAIDRILRRLGRQSAQSARRDAEDVLELTVGRSIRRLKLAEILWFRADGDHVVAITDDAEYAIRTSLSRLAERLAGGQFERCHRSALINLSQVRSFKPDGSAMVALLRGGETVPVSRRYGRTLRRQRLQR